MFSMKVDIHAVIKGYHGYKVKPAVGDTLQVVHEPGNPYDPKAMVVCTTENQVVGHVPATPVQLSTAMFDIWKDLPAGTVRLTW